MKKSNIDSEQERMMIPYIKGLNFYHKDDHIGLIDDSLEKM